MESDYLIWRHVALLFRDILWFGPWRSHSSAPTRRMMRPWRAAAVKDGRFLRPPGGLVLDGREHDGRLVYHTQDSAGPGQGASERPRLYGEPCQHTNDAALRSPLG